MQHRFVRAVLLSGPGSLGSWSFKGRACDIGGLELTLTGSRYERV